MFLICLLLLAAYLLGSVPSAVWIGRRFYGIDVREHGSHNAGTTNTLRVLGQRAAAVVFAMDILKGFLAVKLYLLAPDAGFWLRPALTAAAVIGHIFPVFAGFRGGKGVATIAGAIMAINLPAVAMALGTFFLVLLFSNYVSLSSMTAGLLLPAYTWMVCGWRWPGLQTQETIFAGIIAVALIFTHRRNIRRLLAGTESKIYLVKRR
jgi:glycerol-3-phosphate acyltransferase PlsY